MKPKPKKRTLSAAVHKLVPERAPLLARRLRAGKVVEPSPEDPLAELRRLVHEHRVLTGMAVRFKSSVSDRKRRDPATGEPTGEVIKTTAPPDIVGAVKELAKDVKAHARELESKMRVLLRRMPLYEVFFRRIYGVGAVTAAYLITMVKIERAATVSQLIRYCGFAQGSNGKSERREGGPKYAPDGTHTDGAGTYNAELKIALVVCFIMMRQRCAQAHVTNKYLRRWSDAKQSALTMQNPRLGRVMRPHEADDKGRRKATDLFLWDLYVMWRTLAGLPIRPDKYSAVRGHYHSGEEARDVEHRLTLEEATSMVFGDETSLVDGEVGESHG